MNFLNFLPSGSASSQFDLTKEQLVFLKKYVQGTYKVHPKTGLVNVKGSVGCWNEGLKDFLGLKFGRVTGNFNCCENELTTLEGSPSEVGGYFDCSVNLLTSLKGAPSEVGDTFDCRTNQLTSLEGAPRKVKGDFKCSFNQLTSLEGGPIEVWGDFSCLDNKIISLDDKPKILKGILNFGGNPALQYSFGLQETYKIDARFLKDCIISLLE